LLQICLGISWLFWGMAFLYLLRISSVFLPVHKFFGPVIYVVLLGGPLIQRTLHSYAAVNSSVPRPLPPQADLPVFPGAEGFGTRTPAGRGGQVLFVTSLADSGPGSLREALNQPFPRTILFRVGGTIELVGEFHPEPAGDRA